MTVRGKNGLIYLIAWMRSYRLLGHGASAAVREGNTAAAKGVRSTLLTVLPFFSNSATRRFSASTMSWLARLEASHKIWSNTFLSASLSLDQTELDTAVI